jgi:hypothetical protein
MSYSGMPALSELTVFAGEANSLNAGIRLSCREGGQHASPFVPRLSDTGNTVPRQIHTLLMQADSDRFEAMVARDISAGGAQQQTFTLRYTHKYVTRGSRRQMVAWHCTRIPEPG